MANEFKDLIPKVKPQNEFADLILGIAPPRPETQMAFRAIPEKSLFTEGKELVLDTAIGLGQGLTGLVKGITDNYKAGDNPVSNFLGDVIAFGDKHISNDLRGARAERQYMIDRAARIGNEGAATRVAIKTIFDNPIAGIDVAAKGTGSVVPLVAAGLAGVGPGILGLIGALSNGGDAASQAAEQLKAMPEKAWMQLPQYRALIEQGMTPVDAKRKLAPGMAIPAQAVGFGTGMISGRTGLEKVVTKQATQVGLNATLRRVGSEFGGEQLESIAPQVAANATTRHYDGMTELNKGLGQTAVDTAIGSAPGTALSARRTPAPQQQPAQTADDAAPDTAALTDVISSTAVVENRQPQAAQAQTGQDNEFADLIPQHPQTDQDFVSRAESAPSAQANASPVASPLPGSQAGPAVPDQAAVVPAVGQAAEVLPRPQEGTANQGNIQPAPLQAEQTGSTMPRQVLAETAPAPSQPQEMASQIARPDGVNIAQEAPEQAAAVLQTVPQERQMPVPAVISERAMQIESPTPGLRPGDIVAADGKPFPNKSAAGPAAKNAGKGWRVAKGGGGFVVRHQPQSDTQIANTKRLQKQQNQVDTDSDSLFAAIAKLGGIRTDQLTKEWGFDPKEIRTIRGAGTKRISTKNGMSPDWMGEALAELGYLSYDQHGKHDLSELFDLFDGELRGSKHYTPQGYERAYREAEAARIEELSQADIEASGLDDLSDDAHDAIEELLDDYPTIDQEEDARISALIEAAWDQPVSGMGGEAQQTAGRAAERGDGSAAEANQEAPPESGADQRAADSADSTQEVKPPFGDVPFSRSGEANTSALEQLAQEDELFQLPKSDKTTVESITADNDPDIKVRKLTNIPGGTHYEFTMPNGLKAWMSDRPYNPYGSSIYGYDLEDGERTEEAAERPGRNAEAVEGKDDVWINVSLLNKGSGYGAKIYNIGATYAHNNGKVFIGDPAGLSDVAMRRWPEQMLSSALKFGTTEHLAPHPRQIKGDKDLGIPRLDWVYGDHLGNIRKLIELNEKNIDNAGGNGGIVYNKKTGQFEDADGNSLTRADLDGMAKVGLGRAAGAGGSTLARHALFKSLVQGESGQVRGPDGILVSLRGQVRQHGAAGSGSALRDIFYSKQRANRPALTVEAVHQAIAADTFNHGVDVYPTLADAPAYVREQVEREGATDVEGFWNTRTNRIALIAENLSSAERAREVARHELIGHYGLENMVGSAEMDRLAQRVIQAEKDGNKVIADLAQQVEQTQPGLSPERRAREIIAVMAERNIQNTITKRVFDAIRKFLKSIGLTKQDMTDAEIAAVLRDAQEYLRSKNRAMVAGEPAVFSRSAIKSVEANIERGRKALNKALLDKTSVHRAMYRNEIGWVDFVWGDARKGIAHIIAQRVSKDGMTEAQAIRFLRDGLIDVIARGEVTRRAEANGGVRLLIQRGQNAASLVRAPGADAFVLTGFEIRPSGGQGVGFDTSRPTQAAPMLTRRGLGADGEFNVYQNENSSNDGARFNRGVNQRETNPNNTPPVHLHNLFVGDRDTTGWHGNLPGKKSHHRLVDTESPIKPRSDAKAQLVSGPMPVQPQRFLTLEQREGLRKQDLVEVERDRRIKSVATGVGDRTQEVAKGSARLRYMGATPDKYSRTGLKVLERMRSKGAIKGEGALLRGKSNNLEVRGPDGQWHRIDHTIDMAHKVDAVTWWNNVGRYYGPKAPEVRAFMLDSNNYELQLRSMNRSAGAKIGTTYLPPRPALGTGKK